MRKRAIAGASAFTCSNPRAEFRAGFLGRIWRQDSKSDREI